MIEPDHVGWQEQVIQLAHLLGWEHLHVRRTVGRGKRWTTATNLKGFPDLFLWHPRHGFVAVELKVGKDKPTPDQIAVLASLAAAGARTMVAYPADLDALRAMLSGASRNGEPSSATVVPDTRQGDRP